MFGKASIKTVPKDSLLSQRYKTWKSCCFSSIITWFDNLNSSDTKGFLILKIRAYLFWSRMYKTGVTDDCECTCWMCISESCYPSLFLKFQLETVLLWLIFMAKTEWNSVLTKIVSFNFVCPVTFWIWSTSHPLSSYCVVYINRIGVLAQLWNVSMNS